MKQIYLPDLVGGGYGDFWRSRKRYRVLKGGKASKKSSTTALNFIVRLMQHPAANLLVIRRVMETHRTSTFAQLRWAAAKLGVADDWKFTLSPLEATRQSTGQKILFRGMDDVMKLASVTVEKGVLCWVWIEEAFEVETLQDFELLDLSAPRGAVPDGLFKQTTLTFNPWNRDHWLKSRFFDVQDVNVDTFTTNYLCNEFLDEADRAVYERMRLQQPRRYAVAGLGEWGVEEGLIFENWCSEAFDIAALRREGLQHIFGLDYGYSNDPTAFVAAAVDVEGKVIYLYDEIYGRHMLNSDIARSIAERGYAKERIAADAAEPKSNEELRRLGLRRLRAAVKGPDSVRAGIARLQEYRMLVHPRCHNALHELAAYRWERGEDGTLNRPVDRDNHLMDALRYAIGQVPTPRNAPPAERLRGTGGGIRSTDVCGRWG